MLALILLAQLTQNPSPMVEHTRAHPRLPQRELAGRRAPMPIGKLFVPKRWKAAQRSPLLIHFHGAEWIAEAAADARRMPVIAIQAGAGSSRYSAPFRDDPALFEKLIAAAESELGVRAGPVVLSSWSAGYGAIREILRTPSGYARVSHVLAIDSIHAGYVNGRPGPLESEITPGDLAEFVQFAGDAAKGRKALWIAHSEIFPGTFASTTEVSDFVLSSLEIRRQAVLRWGPMKTQILSDTKRRGLRVIGFAGNAAPDHVDQFHALPELLRMMLR